jgi:hypothetical protein
MIASIFQLGQVHPLWPDGSFGDPTLQRIDLPGGQRRALRWHPFPVFVARDELEEWAVLGVAGNNGRPIAIATVKSRRLDIQPQAGLLLLFSVAFITVFLKDRANVSYEIDRCGQRGDWPATAEKSQVLYLQYHGFLALDGFQIWASFMARSSGHSSSIGQREYMLSYKNCGRGPELQSKTGSSTGSRRTGSMNGASPPWQTVDGSSGIQRTASTTER